jgi:hypothetical protein
MAFSMTDYLETYRKTDLKETKEILKNKWTKSLAIIKEAFSDRFVNKSEALRVVRNEMTKGECSDKIDVKFLNENLKYIEEKIQSLDENQIKIIINANGAEKKKELEVSDLEEAKKSKRGRKPKKDSEESEEELESDVIVDEPVSQEDALEVSSAEAPENPSVTIRYLSDEKKLEVIEGEETIESLDVDDVESIKQILSFLQDFYKNHDYIVTEEGLEDLEELEASHESSETPEEEKAEHEGGSESNSDEESDLPMESENLTENKKTFGFLDLLESIENFSDTKIVVEDTQIPSADSLVGKAVEYKNNWYTIKETDDSGLMIGLDKDGGETKIPVAEISDWEKDVLPKKESVELKGDVVEEAAKKVSMPWLKKKSPSTSKSGPMPSAIDKKKDVKSTSMTKSPMKKTGEKIEKVKIPAFPKKGESSANLTGKSGTKSPSKVPSVPLQKTEKKEAPTGSYSKSPMKVSGKVASVTVPKTLSKPAPSGNFSKKPSKPSEKIEKVAAPKLK